MTVVDYEEKGYPVVASVSFAVATVFLLVRASFHACLATPQSATEGGSRLR